MNRVTTPTIPFSEACERNKGVILEKIDPVLKKINTVLEVGSGTAQHAVHFARTNAHLTWQTSDQEVYIEGIKSQLQLANLANIKPPIKLDVKQRPWCTNAKQYDAVYTANTLHIMTLAEVESFFDGLPCVLNKSAFLFVYGPFKYDGEFTSDSNQQFDMSLRSRHCGSAIRDFEWVRGLSETADMRLINDVKMPANNQLLIWQKN